LTIIAGLVLFTVMVVSHEFGHFIVAKSSGIGVIRFSIGLGPKLLGFRFRGTEYTLSLLPLGGYVKMKGMELSEVKGEKDEFYSKSIFIRSIVVLAGPFFNLILAFLLYFFTVCFFGVDITPGTSVEFLTNIPGRSEIIKKGDKIEQFNGIAVNNWYEIFQIAESPQDSFDFVMSRNDSLFTFKIANEKDKGFPLIPLIQPIIGIVEKNSPAYNLGLIKGDSVFSVNGKEIRSFADMRTLITKNPGIAIELEWSRDGKPMKGEVVPKKQQILENGKLKDIGFLGIVAKTQKLKLGFAASLKEGADRTVYSMKSIFSVIIMLFAREISPKTLGGPISIFQLAGESARWGIDFYLGFMALLSINLFILNLIPFPPLDGGHLLLFVIEKITKRRPTEKQLQWILQIGFAILLVLIAYVFYNDIIRLKNR